MAGTDRTCGRDWQNLWQGLTEPVAGTDRTCGRDWQNLWQGLREPVAGTGRTCGRDWQNLWQGLTEPVAGTELLSNTAISIYASNECVSTKEISGALVNIWHRNNLTFLFTAIMTSSSASILDLTCAVMSDTYQKKKIYSVEKIEMFRNIIILNFFRVRGFRERVRITSFK